MRLEPDAAQAASHRAVPQSRVLPAKAKTPSTSEGPPFVAPLAAEQLGGHMARWIILARAL
jgi:hypothetical protein